jgi:hypothetical protein
VAYSLFDDVAQGVAYLRKHLFGVVGSTGVESPTH